jgi:hypothetical protein
MKNKDTIQVMLEWSLVALIIAALFGLVCLAAYNKLTTGYTIFTIIASCFSLIMLYVLERKYNGI